MTIPGKPAVLIFTSLLGTSQKGEQVEAGGLGETISDPT